MKPSPFDAATIVTPETLPRVGVEKPDRAPSLERPIERPADLPVFRRLMFCKSAAGVRHALGELSESQRDALLEGLAVLAWLACRRK